MGTQYSRQEAEEILRRALQGEQVASGDGGGADGQVDGIAHDDLLAAAEEVGVSPEALEQAVAQVGAERERIAHEDSVLLSRQRSFRGLLGRIVLFGGGLLAADLGLGLGLGSWPWLPVLLAVWLGVRGKRAFFPAASDLARAVELQQRRAQRRQARAQARARYQKDAETRRERKHRTKAQLQRVVDHGLDVLLSAAAETLEGLAKEPGRGAGRGGGPRVRVAAPAAQTQRELGEADTLPEEERPRDRGGRR